MKSLTRLCVGGMLATMLAGCNIRTIASAEGGPVKPTRPPYDASIIDKDISFWRAKVAYDPSGALGWSSLASAYLRRAKESDSMEAAQAAEAATRKSLSLRRQGNVSAANKLVSALLEQHRFHDALEAADSALALNPQSQGAQQHKVDVLLELGRYQEAYDFAAKNEKALEGPSGVALRARIVALQGQPEQAVGLLREATDAVEQTSGPTRETLAWFHFKLGTALLDAGQVNPAKNELAAALQLHPKSYKAMIGLQKVAAAERDGQAMVDWGHRAEAIVSMPESLAMMADGYTLLGDTAMAKEHLNEALAAAGVHEGTFAHHHHHGGEPKAHGHPLDRQLGQILLDHSLLPKEALAAAKRDLLERADGIAFANLALALSQNNQPEAAQEALRKAMAFRVLVPRIHDVAAKLLPNRDRTEH